MNYLLILHVSLGAMLLIVFVARFILVISKRIGLKAGRSFVGGLGLALVASGVSLSVVTKSPLTGTCLSALGIIAFVVALEVGFSQLLKNKVSIDK